MSHIEGEMFAELRGGYLSEVCCISDGWNLLLIDTDAFDLALTAPGEREDRARGSKDRRR